MTRARHSNLPYGLVARYYDELHGPMSRMNRVARERVLGEILSRARTVCDLGCGTGTTAIELARGGRKVHAVDLSPAMCRQAREKARRAGLAVRVICADLRTFRLPEQVDLVTCEFNPLNHLPQRQDLPRAFAAVARALRQDGYFYFDLNTPRSLEKQYSGTHWFERRNFCLVLEARYDRRHRKGCLDFHWFLRAGKRWRRALEHLEDVAWSDREIRRALHRAGFSKIRAWDAVEVRPRGFVHGPGYDKYYLAQKVSARSPSRV